VALLAAAAVIIMHPNTPAAAPSAGQSITSGRTSPGQSGNIPQPVISRAAAPQVLARDTRLNNQANLLRDNALLSAIESAGSCAMDTGTYRMQRAADPANRQYAAFSPAKALFYIPRQPASTYPHFFVAQVAYAHLASPQHVTGTGYLLFAQASRGAP
jgi:hypothetical protein